MKNLSSKSNSTGAKTMNVPICQILPKSQTNRSFCQIMILIWTAVLTAAASAAAAEEDRTALIDHLRNWNGNVQPTKIVSWNAYSRQFIDAPTFKLLPMPKVTKYTAEVKQGQQSWKVESHTPFLSLETIWPQMENKIFTLNFQWLDQASTSLAAENTIRVKAPDWQGLQEPDADWRGAADRNMNYFIHAAWHGKAPYREPNVPVWIWSSASPTVTQGNLFGDFPEGYSMSYPAITQGQYIWSLLAYADRGGPQKEEALRLARITADWGLKTASRIAASCRSFPIPPLPWGNSAAATKGPM